MQPVRHSHEYLAGLSVPSGDECLQCLAEGFVTGFVPLHDFSCLLVDDKKVVVFV